MNRNIRFLAACALLMPAGESSTLYSQSSGAPDASATPADTAVHPLPIEVIITGARMTVPLDATPGGTSIVGRDDLKVMPRGASIDEAMAFVPGVKVDNQSNGERVHMSIRGQGILTETGIRSIKVLLDEIPVNDPSGLAPDFFDVDLNTVERIEVLRGPATSLYGGGAAGGIVNIVTQNSPHTPLAGEFSTTAGSNRFWKGFGQFGGDVNEVNYRVSFSRTGGGRIPCSYGFLAEQRVREGDVHTRGRVADHSDPLLGEHVSREPGRTESRTVPA